MPAWCAQIAELEGSINYSWTCLRCCALVNNLIVNKVIGVNDDDSKKAHPLSKANEAGGAGSNPTEREGTVGIKRLLPHL